MLRNRKCQASLKVEGVRWLRERNLPCEASRNVSGGGLLVAAIALTVGSLVAGSAVELVAPTPAYAASKKSSKKSKDGSVKGVKVKKKVDKYTWSELAKISDAMTESGSRKAALKIAKKYKLCDKKGKLDGSQTKRMTTSSGETSARIVGFYHDDLSDGSGKAGITWQFADGMCYVDYNQSGASDADHSGNIQLMDGALQDLASGSYLTSDVASRLATVTVKTASMDSIMSGEAVSSDKKLWAPSAVEVLGDAEDMSGVNRDSEWMPKALNAEGTQYDLFKNQGLSWNDQRGAFSDYPTKCLYAYGYSEDDYEDTNPPKLRDDAKPQIFDAYGSDDHGFITVYRSLYVNPKNPDATVDNMAVAIGQSGVSDCGRYTSMGTGIEKVIQPLFCLTAVNDDSTAEESNGISIQDSVDNYSWKDLKVIADEIAAAKDEESATGIAKKYHLVGDDGYLSDASYKTVKLKSGVESKAYIAAFNHDERSDGKGKAGITFVVGDTPLLTACMNQDGSNSGGWKDSDLRKALNKEVFASMPKDLKNNIVKVKKLTNNAGVTTDVSSVTETDDSVWVPSAVELFGKETVDRQLSYQTDQLAVYEAEGEAYAFARGSSDFAWTRSCNAKKSGIFWTYLKTALTGSQKPSSDTCGVYPGFCL